MTRQAILFGTGSFAEVVEFYLAHDSDYAVAGFCATADAIAAPEHRGRKLVAFEEVERHFPPGDYDMFVAVGYAKLNRLRERFCGEARARGYRLLSHVCSKATRWPDLALGDNVFVFEDNTLQPFVTIGDGTIVWSGNHIGHHSAIGRCCFLSSHIVVSGHCRIGDRCFVGVNATLTDGVTVADDNLIGANTLIQADTRPGEAYLAKRTEPFGKGSAWFFR